jgi:hypothetical protein
MLYTKHLMMLAEFKGVDLKIPHWIPSTDDLNDWLEAQLIIQENPTLSTSSVCSI